MTMIQETCEEMSQHPVSDAERKMAALQRMEALIQKHPFPKDYDWEKAREEAMREKYGEYM